MMDKSSVQNFFVIIVQLRPVPNPGELPTNRRKYSPRFSLLLKNWSQLGVRGVERGGMKYERKEGLAEEDPPH